MSKRLGGSDVAAKIREDLISKTAQCREKGVNPTLAIVRVGARPDDLAYEKRVKSNCEKVGLEYTVYESPDDISQEDFEAVIKGLNDDSKIDGILVFRPLPETLDEEKICSLVSVSKDVDCMNPESLAGVFLGKDEGFGPCTPEAVMEILRYYDIPLSGASAVVVNRSMVLGKPLSQMLLRENATVTVCHSKTKNMADIIRSADIVVTGVGRAGYFTADCFSEKNTVIDVGINFKDGKMTGDVDYEGAEAVVSAITPVPGGVGPVTSMILLKHTADSAWRRANE